MKYYTIKKSFFIPSYIIKDNEVNKLDKFLKMINDSGACDVIYESLRKNFDKGGRPNYNPYNLLACIIYCFAFSNGSLREIEDKCLFDLRAIYIMQNEYPTHMTISNYINDYIKPNQDKLFSLIVKQIFKECSLNMDIGFIDGSKFEANANKYKFVWKPTKFHINLSNKINTILKEYGLEIRLSKNEIISSKDIAVKISKLNELISNYDFNDKSNKKHKKNFQDLNDFLNKSLEYEEKERICGQNRNSYYKTDIDATAMCLKEDYYSGLGSNMHAAYNTQLLVMNGFITCFIVTQSRNDLNDFIKILNRYYLFYKDYPRYICADSGYGSFENCKYLDEKKIENYVKYHTWEGNVSGKNPSQYTINDDDTITCINGYKGYKVDLQDRYKKDKNNTFYRIDGCKSCDYKYYCKKYMKDKEEDYKIFEVNIQLQKYIKQAENNLLSIKGIELRVNRSIQVEGSYGVIKQDLSYNRFRRRSIEKVSIEFMLVCLGYNIRKYFKYLDNKSKFEYWIAPLDLKPEQKKKPSIKRLNNRVNKKNRVSSNEKSKKRI